MPMTRIIGIILVRNDDLYIGPAIRNIGAFCDEILAFDHRSTDKTWSILKSEAIRNPRIRLQRIQRIEETQTPLEAYFGTPTWVFGVDGDEVYDPVGLRLVREWILAGKWDHHFHIYGNVLNCVRLDMKSMKAWGHLSPPAHSMSKLYNFAHLKRWEWSGQRLHGTIVFQPGFDEVNAQWTLYREYDWEESPFRCLHMALMRRSSFQWLNRPRFSPSDKLRLQIVRKHPLMAAVFAWNSLKAALQGHTGKDDGYRRGSIIEKNIQTFFP